MKITKVSNGHFKLDGDWCNLYELIDLIASKAHLFLRDKKASNLDQYIEGYRCALQLNKLEKDKTLPLFDWFAPWLFFKLDKHHGATAGWIHHLLEFCDQNEELAYERFFVLLEEFRSSEILFSVVEATRILDDQATIHRRKGNPHSLLKIEMVGIKACWLLECGDEDEGGLLSTLWEDQDHIFPQGYNFQTSWESIELEEGKMIFKKYY